MTRQDARYLNRGDRLILDNDIWKRGVVEETGKLGFWVRWERGGPAPWIDYTDDETLARISLA